MSTNKRAVHVATITRHHKGKTYVTHLLRHSYREEKLVTAMVVLRIIAPASKLTNFTSMQYETAQHGLAYMEPSHTGINVYGRGHVVAHDRITQFSDSLAIANFGPPVDDLEKHCVNIDFHNNDLIGLQRIQAGPDGPVRDLVRRGDAASVL